MDIMLQGVVGSTAYGLDHAGSDQDRLGIFVRPTSEILAMGYNPHKDSVVVHDPSDSQHHELAKYMSLALQGNPTILELLFLGAYEIQTPEGAELVAMRHSFLSNKVRASYGGYALTQIKKLQARGDGSFAAGASHKRAKHARHCFRLLQQGRGLLETGDLTLRVKDRDELFRIGELPDGELVELFTSEFAEFDATPSVLPDEPDREMANELLLRVRKSHW